MFNSPPGGSRSLLTQYTSFPPCPSPVSVFQGAAFFDSLLMKLQAVFQFKLEDYMDGMAIRSRPLRKTVRTLPEHAPHSTVLSHRQQCDTPLSTVLSQGQQCHMQGRDRGLVWARL